MTRIDCFRFALLASTALSAVPAAGRATGSPPAPAVAHGSVDISTPAANAMAIRQSSDTAIVNWHGFSIGEGARVDIRQPSTSSAMLNRVTGSTPSSIAGQLNANGQVYLVNPNGIAITPTGTVRTGAFVASTLATTDEDFIAGRRSFAGKGRSAAVSNQGSIEVGPGGYAALIGGKVDNSGHDHRPAWAGSASAPASRRRSTSPATASCRWRVPSDGDGDDEPAHHATAAGSPPTAAGSRSRPPPPGRWPARSINLSGVVEARSVSGRSGAIVLGGGDGGRVRVSGRLDASAAARRPSPSPRSPRPPRPERGGSITVTGDAIELAGATLDASGPAGGGTVRVGGDYQGGGDLPRAATTTRRRRHDHRRRRPRLRRRRQRRRLVRRAHRLRRPHLRPRRPASAATAASPRSPARRRWLHRHRRPLGRQRAPSARCSSTPPTSRSSRVSRADQRDRRRHRRGRSSATRTSSVTDRQRGQRRREHHRRRAPGVGTANTLTLDADNDIAINAPITAPDGGLTLAAGDAVGIDAPITIATLDSTASSTTTVNASIAISAGGSLSMTGTDTFLAAPITAGDGADLSFDTVEGFIDVDGAISLGEDAFLTFSSGADLSSARHHLGRRQRGRRLRHRRHHHLRRPVGSDGRARGRRRRHDHARRIGRRRHLHPRRRRLDPARRPAPGLLRRPTSASRTARAASIFLRALGGDGTAAAPS